MKSIAYAKSAFAILALMFIVTAGSLVVSSSANAAAQATPPQSKAPTSTTVAEEFRAITEQYFNSYMGADVDRMLATLHPQGPMNPAEWAIKQLRDTAKGNAVPGEAKASDVKVTELNDATASVKMTLKMRADVQHNGNYREQTSVITVQMRKLGRDWRIWKIDK